MNKKTTLIISSIFISQANCIELLPTHTETPKKTATLIFPEPYVSQTKSRANQDQPDMLWVPSPIEVQPWQMELPPIATKLAGNSYYFGAPSRSDFREMFRKNPSDKAVFSDKLLFDDYLFLYNDHVERLKRDIQLRKDGLLKPEEGEIDFIRYYPCQSYPEFQLWKIELHKRLLVRNETIRLKESALKFETLKRKYEKMGIKEEEYKNFIDMKIFYPIPK